MAHQAADPARDQSYFLYGTTDAQLEFLRFPLGGLPKSETRRIAQELKIEGFINAVTGTFTVGDPVIAKPDRWRDTVSWAVGTGSGFHQRRMLYTRAYEYLGMYWPDRTATDRLIRLALDGDPDPLRRACRDLGEVVVVEQTVVEGR